MPPGRASRRHHPMVVGVPWDDRRTVQLPPQGHSRRTRPRARTTGVIDTLSAQLGVRGQAVPPPLGSQNHPKRPIFGRRGSAPAACLCELDGVSSLPWSCATPTCHPRRRPDSHHAAIVHGSRTTMGTTMAPHGPHGRPRHPQVVRAVFQRSSDPQVPPQPTPHTLRPPPALPQGRQGSTDQYHWTTMVARD
jgi:hypothetical protein